MESAKAGDSSPRAADSRSRPTSAALKTPPQMGVSTPPVVLSTSSSLAAPLAWPDTALSPARGTATPKTVSSRPPSLPGTVQHSRRQSGRVSRRTSGRSSALQSHRPSRTTSPEPRTPTPTSCTPLRSGARTPRDTRHELELAESVFGRDSKEALQAATEYALSLEEERTGSEEAGNMLRRALAGLERLHGQEHPETLRAVNNLAVFLDNKGDHDAALSFYQRAVTGRRKQLGATNPLTLDSLYNLATFFWHRGKLEEAEGVFREARDGCLVTFGRDHHGTLDCTERLIDILEALGKPVEPVEFCRQLLATRDASCGPRHPDALRTSARLAGLLAVEQRLAEAQEAYRESLRRHREGLSPDDPTSIEVVYAFANFLEAEGHQEEAEVELREALVACEQACGPDSPAVLGYVDELAILLEGCQRPQEAETLFRRALQDRMRFLGEHHEDTLRAQCNLAVFLDNEGCGAEALELYRKHLSAQTSHFGESHPKTLESSYNLAVCLADQGETTEAVSVFMPLFRTLEKQLGPDSEWVIACAEKLGELLKETNKLQSAEVMFRRVYEHRANAKSEEVGVAASQGEVADAAYNLGVCILAQQQRARSSEAEELMITAVNGYLTDFGADDAHTLDATFNLAASAEASGRNKDAELLYEVATEGRRRVLGADHEDTVNGYAALVEVRRAKPVVGGPSLHSGRPAEASERIRQVLTDLRRSSTNVAG